MYKNCCYRRDADAALGAGRKKLEELLIEYEYRAELGNQPELCPDARDLRRNLGLDE